MGDAIERRDYVRAMRPWILLSVVALCGAGCSTNTKKSDRDARDDETSKDCPPVSTAVASSAAPSGSAASVPRKPTPGSSGDDLCGGLAEQGRLNEAVRAINGDLMVGPTQGYLTNGDQVVAAALAAGAVEAEAAIAWNGMAVASRSRFLSMNFHSAPRGKQAREALAPFVSNGRLPEDTAEGEVALGRRAIEQLGLAVGDTVQLYGTPSGTNPLSAGKAMKIVGILDFPFAPMLEYDDMMALASPADVRALGLMLPNIASVVRIWLPKQDRAAAMMKLLGTLQNQPALIGMTSVSSEQVAQRVESLRPMINTMCTELKL